MCILELTKEVASSKCLKLKAYIPNLGEKKEGKKWLVWAKLLSLGKASVFFRSTNCRKSVTVSVSDGETSLSLFFMTIKLPREWTYCGFPVSLFPENKSPQRWNLWHPHFPECSAFSQVRVTQRNICWISSVF